MADKKITELTALTVPATDDLLPIVDTDAGTTKKITYANLVAPLGAWQAWNPTFTGWTGAVFGVHYYTTIGKLCIAKLTITGGTSNATGASVTLPIQAATIPNIVWDGACGRCVDNTAILTTPCRWEVSSAATEAAFYKDMGTGTWTNSGTKLIRATIIYQIA